MAEHTVILCMQVSEEERFVLPPHIEGEGGEEGWERACCVAGWLLLSGVPVIPTLNQSLPSPPLPARSGAHAAHHHGFGPGGALQRGPAAAAAAGKVRGGLACGS